MIKTTCNDSLNEKGWVILDELLEKDLVDRLNADLDRAYSICRDIQLKNGIEVNTDGTVHHVVVLGDSNLELLDKHIPNSTIESYFNGKFILNTFGGVINMKNRNSYVCNVHRDIRSFSGDIPLMLNMLVMLDDFTLENGATYLLTGSHRVSGKPSDDNFFANAERAVGKAGSILLFNSNLWHAAGKNTSDDARRALTLAFTRPFMKQQLDYPKAISNIETLSDNLKQILGFNSRIPSTLDEWYQPPEKRMYKSGQG